MLPNCGCAANNGQTPQQSRLNHAAGTAGRNWLIGEGVAGAVGCGAVHPGEAVNHRWADWASCLPETVGESEQRIMVGITVTE